MVPAKKTHYFWHNYLGIKNYDIKKLCANRERRSLFTY